MLCEKMRYHPDPDEQEENDYGTWWICHRCGSLWAEEIVASDFVPLSCLNRINSQEPSSTELSTFSDLPDRSTLH